MDESQEERKRGRHIILESRGRQAVYSKSITCPLPNLVPLIHSLLLSHYLPPSDFTPRICHKSGGSRTVGEDKMTALTFNWQKKNLLSLFIYQYTTSPRSCSST